MKFTTLALTLALAAFATTAHAAGGSLRGHRTLSLAGDIGDVACDILTVGACAICQDERSTLQSNVNSVALTVTELKKEADASQAQVNALNHAAYIAPFVVARARVDGLTLEKYAADYTEHATEAYAHYVCDMKVYGNANPAPGIWGVASIASIVRVFDDVFFAKSLGAVAKMDRKAKEAAKEADTCYAAMMTAYTVMKSTTPCTAGTANQWCGLPNDGNNHAAFEANSKAYIAAVGEANALFTRYQAAKKRLASAQSQYDSFDHSMCGKMMSFFNGAVSDIEDGLEAAYTALKCPVVTKATHWIFGKAGGMAGKLLSDKMCVEFDVEAATACEAVGLGPEDPLADTCAVALGTAITLACKQAVKAGTQAAGNQLADLVIEKAGC